MAARGRMAARANAMDEVLSATASAWRLRITRRTPERGTTQDDFGGIFDERHDQGRCRERIVDLDRACGQCSSRWASRFRPSHSRTIPKSPVLRCWCCGSRARPARPTIPVAKGWLRASHRELDENFWLPFRPYHAHRTRSWLKAREPVRMEVEIWPTSMVFKRGHRIRLDVQPHDGIGSAPYTHYWADYDAGATNAIHAGGSRASYLLLPVIL